MRKTILIPTDFSIGSLNVLKAFLSQNNNNDIHYDVILLHGYQLSNSISDMLFFSKNRVINSLVVDEFKEACHVIKNKFGVLNSIRMDLFTGFTQAAFENYLEANRVAEICVSNDIQLKGKVNLRAYLKKASVAVTEIPCGKANDADFPELEQNITAVFASNPVTISINT